MSLSLSQTLKLELSGRNKVKVGHCLLLVTEDDSWVHRGIFDRIWFGTSDLTLHRGVSPGLRLMALQKSEYYFIIKHTWELLFTSPL